jgi:hypothetical protein
MNILAKIGAVAFGLWGLLHIIGGAAILFALEGGPDQGYALYQNHAGTYTPLSGAILGYFAFLLICIAVAVSFVAVRLNWRNSKPGLVANTLNIGLTDLGLILYLLVPGFVTWGEAAIGLGLFGIAVVSSGLACRATHT